LNTELPTVKTMCHNHFHTPFTSKFIPRSVLHHTQANIHEIGWCISFIKCTEKFKENASQDYLTNIAWSGGGVIFDHARNSRHCYPSAVIICTTLHWWTRAEK
jgi:hypothetical protein